MTEPLDTTTLPLLHTAALTPHPNTSNQTVRGIEVQVCWHHEDTLALTYTLTGNCPQLQIPPARHPARADNLWRHTCFEAFLSLPGDTAYQEWNFSPSGEWAVYHFRGYRDRLPLQDDAHAPVLSVHQTREQLGLQARIRLPHQLAMHPLQLAVSAVIEEDGGTLSYWALKHPLSKPDFHHRDAFVLEVAPLNDTMTRKEPQ